MLKATVLALALSAASASNPKIAGYAPGSDVTDHNALDLDMKALESFIKTKNADKSARTVTEANVAAAQLIYEKGGKSRAVAKVTMTADVAAGGLKKGAEVKGLLKKAGATNVAIGKLYKDAAAAQKTVKVIYNTGCVDGGYTLSSHADKDTDSCLKDTGNLDIGALTGQAYTAVTNEYRTLKGFSVGGDAKMLREPYFIAAEAYHGDSQYGDKYVTAAFDKDTGDATNEKILKAMISPKHATFTTEYEKMPLDSRIEMIKKGTVYLNVFMYTIHEMEDAIEDCVSKCASDSCNDQPVHAWDEAVAFYTGSLVGQEYDTDKGVLLWALAEKRCSNFKTCADDDKAVVNKQLIDLFTHGKNALNQNKCDLVIPIKNAIVQKMMVPQIQGVLRYAFYMDGAGTNANTKSLSEGNAFAMAVAPFVATCRRSDADVLRDTLDIAKHGTLAVKDADDIGKGKFAAVKAAFERNYECLNITCTDIGGYENGLKGDEAGYFAGAEPCTFKINREIVPPAPEAEKVEVEVPATGLSDLAIGLIAGGAGLAVIFLFMACYCKMQKDNTVKMYNDLKGGGK